MVGREKLFSRMAAVCFILVFALMLRTITDNDLINAKAGTAFGILYTFLLIFWGWRLFTRKNQLAPVFPISGALLLFAVILESHVNFQTLPAGYALLILFAAQGLLSFIGLRYQCVSILYFATVGIMLTGLAIDFPHNNFTLAALLLFAVNLIALITKHRRLTASLPWLVLALTILFWLLWSFKLSVPLRREETPEAYLGLQWFLPMLTLYFLLFSASLLFRLRNREPLGFFHGTLPTITVLFCYLAAMTVVIPWNKSTTTLGSMAGLIAVFYYALAALAGQKKINGAPGCNAITFAGTVLLAISLPQAIGLLKALPVLSCTAYLLAIMAGRWQSGGVRLTSYLLQAMVCLAILMSLTRQIDSPWVSAIASLTLAIMAALQYIWCRRHKPAAADSAYFAWLDRRDVGAVILLLSSLIGFFGLFRITLSQILTTSGAEYGNAFYCGQTIIINVGAIALMMVAARRHNFEMLLISMIVVFLSAIKVFIFDLFSTRGLPLVISVFSFGLVALAGSLTVKRWQKENRFEYGRRNGRTGRIPANGMPDTSEGDSLFIE